MAHASSTPAMSSSILRRLSGVVVEEQEIQDAAEDSKSPVYFWYCLVGSAGAKKATYLDSCDQ